MHDRHGREPTLDEAMERAHAAEKRAEALAVSARARIADADARSIDADAQTRHAKTGITAADAHMEAARIHMEAANLHEADAQQCQERADRQMAEAAALLASARDDSAEYQRAVYHYTQLVRHRMANPIHIICGAARTLMDMPDMDQSERLELTTAIHEQAQVLERVCLQPLVLDDTENSLRPRPFE